MIDQIRTQIQEEMAKLQGSTAIYVKFIDTQETVEINADSQFWAASVIKIPIACEFFKQSKNGVLNESQKTKIADEDLVEGTGVIKLLDRSDEFTYLDLVKLMLATSDNTATNQIVDLIGWENVEKYMHELGLTDTTFRHKMMIKAGRGPNLTTAKNIATLLEKLYNHQIAGAFDILEILKQQQDRTRIPLLLPNEVPVAHKPGSLPEAMHDVGIVYSKNPFIFVFLSDDQKDKRLTNDVLSKCVLFCHNQD